MEVFCSVERRKIKQPFVDIVIRCATSGCWMPIAQITWLRIMLRWFSGKNHLRITLRSVSCIYKPLAWKPEGNVCLWQKSAQKGNLYVLQLNSHWITLTPEMAYQLRWSFSSSTIKYISWSFGHFPLDYLSHIVINEPSLLPLIICAGIKGTCWLTLRGTLPTEKYD